MTVADIFQIVLFIGTITILTPLIGGFMAKVFAGERTFLHKIFGKPEKWIYKASGISPNEEMNWKTYAWSMLGFNLIGFLVVFLLQLLQNALPLNPQGLPEVSWHLSLNTAISFVTNTNWQSYSGETTLSYLTQMLGLTVQNFLSAATGIAVLIALARGIARKSSSSIGNFWEDMTRSTLYILLPLSIILAIVLVSQGVIQNFAHYIDAKTIEGATQSLPMGPAASQIAIKQLGTNGGGFFGANSAVPFENPTPFSNFLEVISILLIPAALTYTYGKIIGSTKQGWTIFGVMMFLFVLGIAVSLYAEYSHNAVFHLSGLMEGKETRFGVTNSILWSSATTVASNGSVNAMHDSLSPIAGLVCMLNIMLGEIIFGGVGAGLYGMLVFVVLTVFITGLMVGRTPEYIGKKIQAFEVKMAIIAIVAPSFIILVFSALSAVLSVGLSALNNNGPHGLSEILYAFSSAAGNNGSAFAGLGTNTAYYNVMLAIGMLVGRFGVILPVLAIAGSLATKKSAPPSAGTMPTDSFLFGAMLVAVILIIGALTFLPALSLGPIIEQFLMNAGKVF